MATMNLDEYLRLPYVTIIVRTATTHDNLCYLAFHPELPGCKGQGTTPEAARDDLRAARRLYVEDLLESEEAIPLPQAVHFRKPQEPEIPQRPKVEYRIAGAEAESPQATAVTFPELSAAGELVAA